MRTLSPILAALTLLLVAGFGTTQAQQAPHQTSLTGCLAQVEADDGAMKFVLQNVSGDDVMADQVSLEAGEGVNMGPHVGHTVTVTGTAAGHHGEEGGEMEGERHDMVLTVANLQHESASCEGGR